MPPALSRNRNQRAPEPTRYTVRACILEAAVWSLQPGVKSRVRQPPPPQQQLLRLAITAILNNVVDTKKCGHSRVRDCSSQSSGAIAYPWLAAASDHGSARRSNPPVGSQSQTDKPVHQPPFAHPVADPCPGSEGSSAQVTTHAVVSPPPLCASPLPTGDDPEKPGPCALLCREPFRHLWTDPTRRSEL